MSRNIVICCDGTGNEYGDSNSNIVKLYSTLIINGTDQVGYYHPGVGTMGSPTAHNKISSAWSVLMGMAFGAGLLANVGDAYRYLMNVYQEGDRVYIFGFSRGAFTARALAGVLHMFGLLCPGNNGLIPYVIRMYAKRSRNAAGMTHTFQVATGFKSTFCRPCPLHLVGVFDTVSSVGMVWSPLVLPYTGQNPDMANGRHAISIDERRAYFGSSLWGAELPNQSVKQVWFAGVHSDVGGSYPEAESGLSKITLEWMLCEAISLGLLVDPVRADHVLGRTPSLPSAPFEPVPPNPLGQMHNSLQGIWRLMEYLPHSYFDLKSKTVRWRIPLGARRDIQPDAVVHESVKQRLDGDPSYRPSNLPATFTLETANTCSFR